MIRQSVFWESNLTKTQVVKSSKLTQYWPSCLRWQTKTYKLTGWRILHDMLRINWTVGRNEACWFSGCTFWEKWNCCGLCLLGGILLPGGNKMTALTIWIATLTEFSFEDTCIHFDVWTIKIAPQAEVTPIFDLSLPMTARCMCLLQREFHHLIPCSLVVQAYFSKYKT